MKIKSLAPSLVLAITLASTGAAFADFTGNFSGFFAPANWTVAVSGNPTFDNTAGVFPNNSAQNVTMIGAVGSGTAPNLPVSAVDYSIVLPGTATTTVNISFVYTFFNFGFAANQAEVLRNGVDVADLSAGGTPTLFGLSGTFKGGDTLDFHLTSVNNVNADVLEVTPVPEPSTLALAGLGGAALLLQLRRKSARA